MRIAIPYAYLVSSIATINSNKVAILRKMMIDDYCALDTEHSVRVVSPFKIRGGLKLFNYGYIIVGGGNPPSDIYSTITEANEKAKSIKTRFNDKVEIFGVYTTRHKGVYVINDMYKLGEDSPWCRNCRALYATDINTYFVFESMSNSNDELRLKGVSTDYDELRLKGVNTDYDYILDTFTHHVTSRTLNANIIIKGVDTVIRNAVAYKAESCMVTMIIAKANTEYTVCLNIPSYRGTAEEYVCTTYKAVMPPIAVNTVKVNSPGELDDNVTDDEVI